MKNLKKITIFLIIIIFYTSVPFTFAYEYDTNRCYETEITYGTTEYCQSIYSAPTSCPGGTCYFDNYCCEAPADCDGNWSSVSGLPGSLDQGESIIKAFKHQHHCEDTTYCIDAFRVGAYVACLSLSDNSCPEGYVLDNNGECIIQTEPDPPAHPEDSECESSGGTTYRFYQTRVNYKEIPAETIVQFIISSFFGPQTCITYYKTNYWDICCDLETIPTEDQINSGYLPQGCYTTRNDLHLQYGDPQAIHTDTYTSPWSEFDPASAVGLSSEMCPWVTGEHVDTDGDGIPNYLDNDIDGDGIENRYDPDVDGDGILNDSDPDIDGDGVPNTIDLDMDGDFIHNHLDDDIDGDGLLNEDDPDADGDGIPNEEDNTPFGPVDEDGNGMPDDLENPDDINGDEDQEDYNSSDFAITEDFLVGDDFDQYMEPEEIEVDTSELEALKDNYGMTLYNLNCQLHVTGDLGVVGTIDQTINFCPWEQSLIAIGYILVAFSGLLCLFRTFS